jgi:hypothetical protein
MIVTQWLANQLISDLTFAPGQLSAKDDGARNG